MHSLVHLLHVAVPCNVLHTITNKRPSVLSTSNANRQDSNRYIGVQNNTTHGDWRPLQVRKVLILLLLRKAYRLLARIRGNTHSLNAFRQH